MKLLPYSLLIFVLLSFYGFSQNLSWATVGTTWHYDYIGFGIEGFTKYEVEKDTIVNTKSCSKVTILHEYSNFGVPSYTSQGDPFFTYEEDSIIYFTTQSQFDTLMNLKASPGDNWTLTNQSCTVDRFIEVLVTGRTTINGCENKWIEYRYQGFTTLIDTFYSYYGSVEHAFAYFDYCQQGAMDKPVSVKLRCYDDGNCNYLNGTPDCESLNVESEVLESDGIRLYPNPFHDEIHCSVDFLNKPKVKVSFYSSTGQLLLSTFINAETKTIDTSNLNRGLYFVQIDNAHLIKLVKY